MRFLSMVVSCLLFAGVTYGQSSSTYMALNQFLNTEFFKEFETLRLRSEKAVKDFKTIQNKYSEEDIEAVRDAYNSSAEMFNAVLLNIKNDLLHKQKRKFLVAFPEDYSKQIEADLYRAKEYYANTFQREVSQVTDGEITGVAIMALLPQLIKYTKLAMSVIKKIKAEIKKFNESLLQKYLIDPYHFKTWDEIN
jgi:hypothetical protein